MDDKDSCCPGGLGHDAEAGGSLEALSANRFCGALMGLAAGDALGATVQFAPAGTFVPLTEIVGGGCFKLAPGEWTDDTAMALCLADSIVRSEGYDVKDQMDTYANWLRQGYMSCRSYAFDVGVTTMRALTEYGRTGEPYCGETHEFAAGNGCVMRLAPVPMLFAEDLEKAAELSGDSARTTHGAPEAVDGCRYYGALIAAALNGYSKDELLQPMFPLLADYWQKKPLVQGILEVASGSFKEKEPPDIRGKGHIVKTIEAALWAFAKTDSFKSGALLVANLGDDADTTAAVYGQLAGAFYGCRGTRGVPGNWIELVSKNELICELAQKVRRLALSIDET